MGAAALRDARDCPGVRAADLAAVMTERRKDDETRARVDEALQYAAAKAASRAARRTARRAAGGYFVLILFLLAGLTVYQRATNGRLDSSEMRACERLQSQRERTNVSEARQYLLLSAVTKSPRASQLVKSRYSELARTTVYDPPTDCRAAVRHPGSYRRPESVSYSVLPVRYAERVVEAAKQRRPQPLP